MSVNSGNDKLTQQLLNVAEQSLLLKLRDGDSAAFEIIYNRYKVRLASNFLRLLRNDELAKDALQDLFIRIWKNRSSIDVSQSFQSYLYRIAENLVIDYYRKISRDKAMQAMLLDDQSYWYQHVEEYLVSKENSALLNRIIDKLPPKQREAFILHKLEGKSYKEISVLMEISTSTINKHIHTAQKYIKSEIMGSPELVKLLLVFSIFKI